MTISNEDRQTMIKYRVEQANEAIKEVKILLNNGLLKLAVNRIYYGMFYILSGLALKHGILARHFFSLDLTSILLRFNGTSIATL